MSSPRVSAPPRLCVEIELTDQLNSRDAFGVGKDLGGIEVPEKGVDYYQPKDVPHGEGDPAGTIQRLPASGAQAGAPGNRPSNAFEDVTINDLIPTIDSTSAP